MELTQSYHQVFEPELRNRYQWLEVRNAAAMIAASDPSGLRDLVTVLGIFHVTVPHLLKPGRSKSELAGDLDEAFRRLGWRETHMRISTTTTLERRPWTQIRERRPDVSESVVAGDTHKVDNVLRRVAVEVEWHAKDGNLDRDLSAFRALYDAGAIDAGVIITRSFVEMYHVANWLARHLGRINYHPEHGREVPRLGTSTSTTMEKLEPRLRRGDAAGCPVLAVGICQATYTPGLEYEAPDGTRHRAPEVPPLTPDEAEALASVARTEDFDDSES